MRREQRAMRENIALEKSTKFAIRIINLYKFLCTNQQEFVLSKQILRSGTSIGANISEADCAITKSDFLAKIYIAYKECSETLYWLRLLKETDYIDNKSYNSMTRDCKELIRMLAATTKTTEKNIKPEQNTKKKKHDDKK